MDTERSCAGVTLSHLLCPSQKATGGMASKRASCLLLVGGLLLLVASSANGFQDAVIPSITTITTTPVPSIVVPISSSEPAPIISLDTSSSIAPISAGDAIASGASSLPPPTTTTPVPAITTTTSPAPIVAASLEPIAEVPAAPAAPSTETKVEAQTTSSTTAAPEPASPAVTLATDCCAEPGPKSSSTTETNEAADVVGTDNVPYAGGRGQPARLENKPPGDHLDSLPSSASSPMVVGPVVLFVFVAVSLVGAFSYYRCNRRRGGSDF